MARRVDTDCLPLAISAARLRLDPFTTDCVQVSAFQRIVNTHTGRTKKGHALY